ncbi:MAG: hypothetical protein Q7S61_01265 [bacterium]|nr:hypothetical protein [bacterium]
MKEQQKLLEIDDNFRLTDLWKEEQKEPSMISKMLGNMGHAIIRFFKMMKDVIIPPLKK